MRVSREQAARNRERTVDAALRAFRAHGFDRVSIAELMASAGLTHGGFYKNFDSKEALELEASELGVERSIRAIRVAAGEPAPSARRRIAERYLASTEVGEPANGCTIAALAVDVGRSDAPVQRVFARGVVGMAAEIAKAEPRAASSDGPDAAEASVDAALGDVAALVGALVLARAVNRADPGLSARILDSTIARVSAPRPS